MCASRVHSRMGVCVELLLLLLLDVLLGGRGSGRSLNLGRLGVSSGLGALGSICGSGLSFLLSLCLGLDSLGQSNLDRDGSVLNVESIELLESSLLVSLVVELDESVSLASVVVLLDNVSLLDGQVQVGNKLGERIVIEAEGQVGNKEKGVGLASLGSALLGSLSSRLSGLSRLSWSSGLLITSLGLDLGFSGLSRSLVVGSLGSGLVLSRLSGSSGLTSLGISRGSFLSRLSLSGLSLGSSIGLVLVITSLSGLSGGTGLSLSLFTSLLSFLGLLHQLDVDLSAINVLVVQLLDGSVGSLLRLHLNETISERSWSTSDDVDVDAMMTINPCPVW